MWVCVYVYVCIYICKLYQMCAYIKLYIQEYIYRLSVYIYLCIYIDIELTKTPTRER